MIAGVAVVSGLVNAVAGGGSLLTFPTLVWLGIPAIAANATNTIGLWPGSLGGLFGFRRDIPRSRLVVVLGVPSLAGGVLGAYLLLNTPQHLFLVLAPFLVLGATVMLAIQEPVSRRIGRSRTTGGQESGRWLAGAVAFQFAVATYGGFFGAGIGILMLGALALIGLSDIHEMNGLKNLFAICINGVAAIYFALAGAVVWLDAGIMAAAAVVGGLSGAALAHRLGRAFVRRAVIVVGAGATISLAIRLVTR